MYNNDVSVCTITMSVHNDDLGNVYISTTCLCLGLCQRVDVDVILFKIQFNQACGPEACYGLCATMAAVSEAQHSHLAPSVQAVLVHVALSEPVSRP